jgi:hypothetical protein
MARCLILGGCRTGRFVWERRGAATGTLFAQHLVGGTSRNELCPGWCGCRHAVLVCRHASWIILRGDLMNRIANNVFWNTVAYVAVISTAVLLWCALLVR